MDIKNLFETNLKNSIPKIIGVGKNYGSVSEKLQKPAIFQKTFNCITREKLINFPSELQINHELELGVVINKEGKNIKKEDYQEYVGGYFLLLDLTEMNFNEQLRKLEQSNFKAKGIDNFLPVSEFITKERVQDPHNLVLQLIINGQEQYQTSTNQMHFNVGEILEFLSKNTTLSKGDLILMGTPQSGKLKNGDFIDGRLFDSKNNLITSLNVEIQQFKSSL